MDNAETIVISVISGIITSAALYLLVLIFNRIILPWYRNFVYRGANITGTWEEELDFKNGNTQVSTIELIQKANDISGSATVVKPSNGQVTKTEIMALRGTLNDRFFNATLIPTNKKRVGIATFLSEVIGDGSRMRGTASWYDANAVRIEPRNSEWVRK